MGEWEWEGEKEKADFDVGDFDGEFGVGVLFCLDCDSLEELGTGEWDDALVGAVWTRG